MHLINRLKESNAFRLIKAVLKPVYNLTFRKVVNSYGYWMRTGEKKEIHRLREALSLIPQDQQVLIVTVISGGRSSSFSDTAQSVLAQIYPNWQWLIFGQPADLELPMLDQFRQTEKVQLVPVSTVQQINQMLLSSDADWVGFLDAGDTLSPYALTSMIARLEQVPSVDAAYSDEDHLLPNGKRTDPWFKGEYNLYTLRSANILRHFLIVRKKLGDQIGWLTGAEDSARVRWLDFCLRLAENAQQIAHIPFVCYHNRKTRPLDDGQSKAEVALSLEEKQAFAGHFQRMGVQALALPNDYTESFRVQYAVTGSPLVSILIPNRDQKQALERCVRSIFAKTTWPRYEIRIIENNSTDPEIFDLYAQLAKDAPVPFEILQWQGAFNYAAINNFAAERCDGEYLLFLNNDTEVITPDWLEELLSHAQQPAVGAAGAKLLFPNQTIQHVGAGLWQRDHDFFYHIAEGMSAQSGGYYGLAKKTSASLYVTGACLMIARQKFEAAGKFNPEFPLSFNDVDLCLTLHTQGYTNLVTPYAQLYHYESISRGKDDSAAKRELTQKHYQKLKAKWGAVYEKGDPYISKFLRFDQLFQNRIK